MSKQCCPNCTSNELITTSKNFITRCCNCGWNNGGENFDESKNKAVMFKRIFEMAFCEKDEVNQIVSLRR